MKMNFLFYSLLLTLPIIATSSIAATVNLDLSQSHSISDIKSSGLQINEIDGGSRGQAYSFQNQSVLIALPTGRSIEIAGSLGIIDTDNQNIIRLSITGDALPHEEALLIAKLFHNSFGLNQDQLIHWSTNNPKEGYAVKQYSVSVNTAYYPRVSFALNKSMNSLYPFVVSLQISWHWEKQRDWNEERAWKEIPAPPAGLSHISLNPPSGKTYDRKDAYSWWNSFKSRFQ